MYRDFETFFFLSPVHHNICLLFQRVDVLSQNWQHCARLSENENSFYKPASRKNPESTCNISRYKSLYHHHTYTAIVRVFAGMCNFTLLSFGHRLAVPCNKDTRSIGRLISLSTPASKSFPREHPLGYSLLADP